MPVRLQERMDVWEEPRGCRVVVIYEDLPSRDLAIQICDNLQHVFIRDMEFDFTWWRLKYLGDSEIARQAAQAAIDADLILLALRSVEDSSTQVIAWFEQWSWLRKH